jgi:phasin family protein
LPQGRSYVAYEDKFQEIKLSNKNNVEFITQAQTGMDVFLAISNAYMLGQERLSMLNAAAIRDTVIEAAKVAKLLADVKGGQDVHEIYNTITSGLFARATAYTKDVIEIATETQVSVGKLNQQKLSGVSASSKAGGIWNQTLEAVLTAPKWASTQFLPTVMRPGNSKHAHHHQASQLN